MNMREPTEHDFEVLKATYGTHGAAAASLGMTGRHYQRIRLGQSKNKWTLQAIAEAAARVRANQPLPAPTQPQEAQP